MQMQSKGRPASRRRIATARGIAAAVVAGAALTGAPPAVADHEAAATSTGIYRLPYGDGTEVTVTNWHHDHNVAYDMNAGPGSEVVAAASGWIRAIVDHHGQEPGAGDGLDVQVPPQPQDDALEHACGNNDPSTTVRGGNCGWYDNYVWIEHPNGEYTKYSHLGTGTVSATWAEGDWIEAGEVIGLENDIGAASTAGGEPGDRASHLHWEVAVPDTPGAPVTWDEPGGFIDDGSRVVARVCDIPGQELVEGDYEAAPCDHAPPSAIIGGGPFVVDEGDTIDFDASESSDPDGLPLSYRWEPAERSLAATATPELTLTDDFTGTVTLTVYDRVEALSDSATQEITVLNVPPAVSVVATPADEGTPATLRATVADPGADTFAAEIDWGDGGPAEAVTIPQLALGVDHVYGDDATYAVAVTVTDDDGGVGVGSVPLEVRNVIPEAELMLPGVVSFPGGDFSVIEAGAEIEAGAVARDEGSDDLAFTWSTGAETTVYNDGSLPDPPLSPSGTFPFEASDAVAAGFADAGVGYVSVTVADDDGGTTDASAGVIATGTADAARGQGWWMHQFSGAGQPHADPPVSAAYLGIVAAVSGVFDETYAAGTPAEAASLLTPSHDGGEDRAVAELLTAWLHFAGGAVSWDAEITVDGMPIAFLELMEDAEQAISSPTTTDVELRRLARDLAAVRHSTS
ncbi:M23 family metallopeptidase [Microbacterium sp. CPCC 204701]|uniref:M23 family metallopeptidase n=1 Tax=Microbacterium sp. CPCC 204701 TaxID=2493084 RepID=UPI000FD84266|nr:M23 family metallopeptidase [Microbacterium sp. CPCC 204701]